MTTLFLSILYYISDELGLSLCRIKMSCKIMSMKTVNLDWMVLYGKVSFHSNIVSKYYISLGTLS